MKRLATGSRDYKSPRRGRLGLDTTRLRDFAIGVVVGLAVAAIVFLAVHRAGTAVPERPPPTSDTIGPDDPARAPDGTGRAAGAAHSVQPASTASAAASSPAGVAKFDFYQMLPRFEVVLPEREHGSRPPPTAQIDRPGIYFLQVGSYRDAAVAERTRAQVARLGIAASVQRVAVDNDVWHRVRIGPIRDLTALNRLRRQLQTGHLDSLVIRVED